jgi:catechol 2,3-dioxygenase
VDPDLTPIRWSLRDPRRQTLWGTPAPRSWFEEGTPFPGTPVEQPLHQFNPVMAD